MAVRRFLLITAALCFLSGTVCFAIGFVGVVQFMMDMPAPGEAFVRVVPLRAWAWRFVALYLAGFVILLLVPDRAKTPNADSSAAAERPGD